MEKKDSFQDFNILEDKNEVDNYDRKFNQTVLEGDIKKAYDKGRFMEEYKRKSLDKQRPH